MTGVVLDVVRVFYDILGPELIIVRWLPQAIDMNKPINMTLSVACRWAKAVTQYTFFSV